MKKVFCQASSPIHQGSQIAEKLRCLTAFGSLRCCLLRTVRVIIRSYFECRYVAHNHIN